ncbi:uncharacterized protein MYCFIDRAFT_171078 [Pseudocercospora fijiensis CIRAD86]|uniref:Uncharacterized protein n=1 Tax=Pseudocercospora fijiensis (strain CIRAD86) TaxID=383855 RepID=N1Q9X4_PSEFD|nr:uncharacterized protein MYCFIDRAFT_171078 [Pseudocercospora fijiensis CIRAD86]EME89659.1 hypothetical protein MYCFIDRAFT_171078 [Pseudocercospora fijiensis CIRAD86]
MTFCFNSRFSWSAEELNDLTKDTCLSHIRSAAEEISRYLASTWIHITSRLRFWSAPIFLRLNCYEGLKSWISGHGFWFSYGHEAQCLVSTFSEHAEMNLSVEICKPSPESSRSKDLHQYAMDHRTGVALHALRIRQGFRVVARGELTCKETSVTDPASTTRIKSEQPNFGRVPVPSSKREEQLRHRGEIPAADADKPGLDGDVHFFTTRHHFINLRFIAEEHKDTLIMERRKHEE